MSLKKAPFLSEITMIGETSDGGISGGTADPYLPTVVPSRKWSFEEEWKFKVNGPMTEYDLKKQPRLTAMLNKITGKLTLCHPEIHVVWRGLVPPTVCRSDLIVTCRFTPDRSERMGLLCQHVHGMHLYMHHVFYPGHSISVGPGTILPWAIGFALQDFELDPDYEVGMVHIRLTGYYSMIPEYATHRESELIAVVPIDEPVTGFRLSPPRVPNQQWVVGGYKLGVSGASLLKKIKLLQEMGVNVEALKMSNRLSPALKLIDDKSVRKEATPEEKKNTAEKVYSFLKTIQA